MRRLPLSVAVLTLSLVGVSIAPHNSTAAPLPAPYKALAGGDLVAIRNLVNTNGPGLVAARLAVAESTMSGGSAPTARATVDNLSADLPGFGLTVQSRTQTAPPDNLSPDNGPVAGASASGVFNLSPLSASVHARTRDPIACSPAGGPLANSQVLTATAILNPNSAGTVVDTGDAKTSGVVSIVPEPPSDPLNRAVRSVATGTITTNDFLDGAVHVDIAGTSKLEAYATGVNGGADVSYNPGAVTVTVGSTTTPVGLGATVPFDVPGGQVVITANQLQPSDVDESPNGQHASASVAVVTAKIRVGSVSSPSATVTVDLLPLRVSADVPLGGIDCAPPPPVLNQPPNGSTLTDTTPDFTGQAFPGSQVDILVDGKPIGTTTALADGSFSFTPVSPIPSGHHVASARASVNGATSAPSNVNNFTIDLTAPAAPTLNKPADGSVTNDRTPPFTGRAEPGAEVEIFVDGNSIGSTTANSSGNFSFTPTTPLAAGTHEAFVGATDPAGNDSPPSNTNGFRIDTEDPAAPGITSPGNGSTTTDTTPTITGSAEPGSQVTILIDGEAVGTTVADENGEFSFTVPDGLSPGEHEVSAVAVDEAGNRSALSDPVSFGVLAAQANAGSDPDQLGQTGGPQAWLAMVGLLGILVGAGILGATRRSRSQA